MRVSLAVLLQGANLPLLSIRTSFQLYPATTPTWPKAWLGHQGLQIHPRAFHKGGFTFL